MLILLLGLVACADAGDPTNPEFQSSSVVALGLWPQDPTIAVGDSLDFVAFGLTAAGDTVALDVTWSASGGEIRGNGKGKGRYNARAAGRNKVKATSDSLSDSTTVTVTDVPVASVAVTPATATVEVSNTVQLTATLRDAAGNALTGRVVSWTTNDATCAVVNANGRVSAVGAGTATITATSEGKSGAASVTVSQASGSALPGDVGDLAVVGQAETALTLALTEVDDGEGNPASYAVRFAPSPISWGGAAGSEFVVAGVQVGATLEFQVSGLASGTQYDVQSVAFRGALGQDAVFSESLSNVATGVTQTNTAAVASVDVTPATASVNEGSTVPLTATVRDAAGTVLTGRAVSWASSNTSVASVNGSGLVSGVAAGAATITATSEGHTGSATISVTATAVASVDVTPATASVNEGSTVPLTATVRDAAGTVLTGRAVSWASSNTSVASVNGSGLVSGVAAGAATITATSEGHTGSATISVTAAPPPSSAGALTFDAAKPHWLSYDDGTPFFLVGAGGPEYFLYDGQTQANGTRSGGRQQTIIDAAITYGWNGIYMMVDASGDGPSTAHPWLDYTDPGGSDKWNANIINQWHGWFQQMDDAGIAIFLILYDDQTDPFGGSSMGAAEEAFVTDLVNEFKSYRHLIWCVAEEYSEALSIGRSREIAAEIRSHDAVHPVANHQHTGTTFDFPNDGDFHQFAMQLDNGTDPNIDPEGTHADVVRAWNTAAGRYNLNAAELQPDHGYPGKETLTRQTNWGVIMGGAYVMVLRWWDDNRGDGNPTPSALEQSQAGYAQAFMSTVRFDLMEPDDSRASGDTEWVLAHRGELGNRYLVGYGRNVTSGIGFTGMESGTYILRWMDTETGAEISDTATVPAFGPHTFAKPGLLGSELVLYAVLQP